MPPRNSNLSSSRQRSKSLPSRYSKQQLLFASKSIPSYKQQMRMVSFQSSKNQLEPKSQTDIPAVQRVLDEFEHILKNLQMTNSDISDLNVLMKELKDRISHFPRFLSVNPEQRDAFFQSWDNLKNEAVEKLNSGRPHSYESASHQLQEAKENIEKIQVKPQSKQANSIIRNLYESFDNIQNSISELIKNKNDSSYDQKKQIATIKAGLLKLQSSAPTTKSNQDIARVLLEFNKIEKKEKSQQILNFNIQKAEKQLQALIQIKPRVEQSVNKKDKQALSTVSTNRKRPKSVGAFDAKSRVSRTSRLSSKSLVSKQLNDYDKKIGNFKSQSLNLNHEINALNIKLSRIQKNIANYQAQLDQVTEINSIERESYKKKVAEKIKKSGIPGCDSYEQKEKHLAAERKNNFDLKQRLKEIDLEEHERLVLEHKILETEQWQSQIDQELKRAKNLYDCLKELTSDVKLSIPNTSENGGIEINFDNDKLQKEKEEFETQLKKKQKSISLWRESWSKSVGANLIDNLGDVPQNDIQLMYKRSEFDHQYMNNWKKDLDAQVDQLKKEASYLEQNGHKLDSDSLNQLKEAVDKLNFYYSATTNPQNREKIPVLKQIQINKMEIDRLSKLENETKSESQEIEDQRNQNRQMIEWVKELMDQIQSAKTSQNGLKAQLDKSMNMINFGLEEEDDDDDEIQQQLGNDTQRMERVNQEINELSSSIYSRDKLKSEYEDNNTNMQQLYESMFDEKTNQTFLQLCPQVKERIEKLIQYHRLKRMYNHLLSPDAVDSDINIGSESEYNNDDSNAYETDNMYDTYNTYNTYETVDTVDPNIDDEKNDDDNIDDEKNDDSNIDDEKNVDSNIDDNNDEYYSKSYDDEDGNEY